MSDLAGLLSVDPRSPVRRLRRGQLWKVADAYNIPYQKDATAEMMVTILEGAGIDVARPLPAGDQVLAPVQVQQEDGSVRNELYPVTKPHATAGKDINYDAILEQKAREHKQAQEALQETNEGLESKLDKMMEVMEHMQDENKRLSAELTELKSQPGRKKPGPKPKAKSRSTESADGGEDLT